MCANKHWVTPVISFKLRCFCVTAESLQYYHCCHTVPAQFKVTSGPLNVTALSVNVRMNASHTAVNVDPTHPELLHIRLVISDDDPSPSSTSAPIRPCWCKLRMESAMMRAVFFWYPPDVTISMGMPRRLAALNTISSLFTMPWRGRQEKSWSVSLPMASDRTCNFSEFWQAAG